ncbi:MAG TPA: site-specific integrase, partial [Rhodocyclaceae bacterium]|nr:site-specific integrase [Rhodocyclaceae bacterium]
MAELFYFDKEIFNQLPLAERSQFQALLRNAVVPTGRPFFLGDDYLPSTELEGFCNYLLGPRRGSSKTWKTYATQVAVFIRFMQAQGKTWQQATKKDLDLYYTVRTTGEFQNKPPLKGRSWNVAKAAIVHLYEYAQDEGIISSVPFKYRKSKALFGGRSVETADLGAKYTPEPINFISVTNYKNLWRPLISDGENSQRNQA